MPFALIIIALILIVTGFKGTTSQFLSNLATDVQGFVVWVVAIVVVGAIGYIPGLKKVSDGFLALILLAMFLSNGKNGLFQSFNSQIRNIIPETGSGSQTPVGNVDIGIPSILSNTDNSNSLRLQPLPLIGSLPGG